jgi:hypothetical protein
LRNDHEIQIGIPQARQVVGGVLLVVAGGVLLGWIPLTSMTVGLGLLLIAAGLLV